jgi:hypothetical protein
MVVQLIIEKGLPFEPGTKLEFNSQQLLLGRASRTEKPDIIFESKFISRRHCLLKACSNKVTLTDLNSKHGTQINNRQVLPGQAIELKPNDRITLSHGAAIFRLINQSELDDETLELNCTDFDCPLTFPIEEKIKLDIPKRQCLVQETIIHLSPKEWQLLLLLYSNFNQPVYYDSIRCSVWPERIVIIGETPIVGLDEINLLIYRLRHKLGDRGNLIKNIRGLGLVLEL